MRGVELIFATILLAFATFVEASEGVPFAIRCDGTYSTTDPQTKKVRRDVAPRIYVINEAKADVAYWNGAIGKAFSLCETYVHACHFDFFPNIIMSKADSEGGDHLDVIIDRRTGMFVLVSKNIFAAVEYTGTCAPTQMPQVDLSARKF